MRIRRKMLVLRLISYAQRAQTNLFFSQIQPITQTTVIECEQVAQLLQRDHTAGWVSYNQKWKTGTGRQYLSTL